jgi:hypothetical protein
MTTKNPRGEVKRDEEGRVISVKCPCGATVSLEDLRGSDTSCDKCGRDFNSSGQELEPPERWEEPYDEANPKKSGGKKSVNPGKFDSTMDALIYDLSTEGVDEECGDSSEGPAWYGLMRGISLADLVRAAKQSNEDFEKVAEDEEDYILDVVQSSGVIVSEDSQGFVGVSVYETDEELTAAWDEKQAECGEGEEEEA